MPANKKPKRDAKDNGGVVAAVTKQGGLKFPNGSAKGTASDNSSPSVQSPEINPIATPSSNGNPTVSPQLDAINGTSFALTPAPRALNTWDRGSPALDGSPGNLISIMGESPPTLPSSYEDPRGLQGWPSPRLPGHKAPMSSSPPIRGRRPLSFQMDQPYQPSEAISHTPSHSYRRSSLHSHIAQSRASPNPPLPHQPQAHFYGAPDIGFNLQPQNGIKAGERGYHFGFDTLPQQHVGNAPGTDQVVTAGYEGGLEVYSVSKRGLEPLANLKGLRGGVYGAKILPRLAGSRPEQGPFVALVVHGPVFQQSAPDLNLQGQGDGFYDRGSSPPPLPDVFARDAALAKNALPIEFYQTCVELYSLKTNELVAVLLEAPKIQLTMPVTSPIFQAPPPSGALSIKADGSSIVVASGATGECWVYRQLVRPSDGGIQFRCVAKLWTTLQLPLSREPADSESRARAELWRPSPRSPIVALRGKWVAYCPANPSSQMALRASVGVPVLGKGPGLASMTPPQLPSVNAELDIPSSESIMNKLVRDAAQELISGAKWVGQQGWQAFNNYWKGSSAASAPRSPPTQPQTWGSGYSTGRQDGGQFPPTHGSATPAVVKDPGLVSIANIETLSHSATVHPMATWAIPLGCSFLSFSPSALSLLTVSTKGDVQSVWDLMRMHFTKGSALQQAAPPGTPNGPRVRQIAQFSRMTVARIVAIAWTRPNGERLSMVTERGTVHVLEMPTSAFAWPPPRRRTRQQDSAAAAAEPQNAASAVSYARSGLTSALDAARPLLPRPRRSSTNMPQSAGARIVDHASMGGKMLATGISHSLGKTGSAISNLRNVGENRTSLPTSLFPPGPGSIVWLGGKRLHSLFILGDGLVRLFPTKTRESTSGSNKGRVMRLGKHLEFKVHHLPDDILASAVKRFLDPEEYLDLTDHNEAGINTLVLDNRLRAPPHVKMEEASSAPNAEIESSAPYQPFHTDRRVALFERHFASATSPGKSLLDDVTSQLEGAYLDEAPIVPPPRRKQQKKTEQAVAKTDNINGSWAFGQAIRMTQLDTGQHRTSSDDDTFSMNTEESRALPPSAMERVRQEVGDADQIVITTRRRRNGGRGPADQDEEGFFEDDCEVLDFADQRV